MQIAGTKYDCRIKLAPNQRAKIIELHSDGLSYSKIAKKFGVSKSTISDVCNPKPRKPQQYNKLKQYKYTKKHREYLGMLRGSGLIKK
jgi:DNA invertase Pin-like site-specific DNA recombinase